MRYLISLFIFTIYLFGFNYHLKPYKISDGIDCFFGLPSQVNNMNGGNMINSCYVEVNNSYVVIDSGPTYSYAQEAYEVMKKKKKLPVKYVIDTSSSEVHILGNEFYKELGAKLLGPKDYIKHIGTKEKLFLETVLTKDAFVNTRVVFLDEYVDENKSLVFNEMNISINMVEGDSDHLYVYIKEKDILFAGDFIFNNRIVELKSGRSLLTWLKGLSELTALKWSDIISSHGYMTRRSALKNTKLYLTRLKSEVSKEIKKGSSRKETIQNVKLLAFSNHKFYRVLHPKNVASAYDELKNFIVKSKVLDKNSTINSKVVKREKKRSKIEDFKDLNNSKLAVSPTIKLKTKVTKEISEPINKIEYKSFNQAISEAQSKNKIVLIKVRSTLCKYCDQLDRIISTNTNLQKILNKYFEVVKIDSDYEEIPLGITVRSTPTLIFIRPDSKEVLMKLSGIRALGELLEILNEAVDDGHNGGYLKP